MLNRILSETARKFIMYFTKEDGMRVQLGMQGGRLRASTIVTRPGND